MRRAAYIRFDIIWAYTSFFRKNGLCVSNDVGKMIFYRITIVEYRASAWIRGFPALLSIHSLVLNQSAVIVELFRRPCECLCESVLGPFAGKGEVQNVAIQLHSLFELSQLARTRRGLGPFEMLYIIDPLDFSDVIHFLQKSSSVFDSVGSLKCIHRCSVQFFSGRMINWIQSTHRVSWRARGP